MTEMFALRGATAPLTATEKGKLPLPCPAVPLDSESQDAPAAAVHVQSRSVVTCTDPLPPEAGKLAGDPAIVTWQRGGVALATEVEVAEPHAAAARTTAHSAANRTALEGGRARGSAGGTPEAQQAASHSFPAEVVSA